MRKHNLALALLLLFSSLFSYAEILVEQHFPNKDTIVTRDCLWDGVDSEGFLNVKGGHLNTLRHGIYRVDYYVGPSICFADVDSDGRPDLVVGGEKGFVWYFPQTSKPGTFPPKFERGYFLHMQCSSSLLHVDVQDMEDDGKPDIVFSAESGEIFYIRSIGNGYFRTQSVSIFPPEPYLGRGFTPRFYDWDGDGNFDLYLGDASYSANAIYFFKNMGTVSNPRFVNDGKRRWLAYGYGHEMLDPCHGDLNGDGKMDLLVADAQGQLLLYYAPEKADPDNPLLLDFAGNLTVDGKEAPVGEGARCYLYDVDRDGLLDLFLSDVKGYFYVARNIGVKARPAFGKLTQLKGRDTWKPYPSLPEGWSEEQRWPYNSAPVVRIKNEEVVVNRMTGERQTITFARLSYADGYYGGMGAMTRHGLSLVDGTNYRIKFKTRGRGGKGRIYFEQWWEGERRGDVIEQTKYEQSHSFPLSEEFNDVSFVHDAHHSSKDIGKEDGILFVLHFYLEAEQTNAFLDISDLEMKAEK